MERHLEIVPVSLSGDLRVGGWIMTAQVSGDTSAVVPGQYLEYRGRSLSGFVDPALRLAFNGYVLGQPDFSFDRYSSQAQIQFATAHALLAGGSLQDLSFAVVASPANSHEATSWTFATMTEHILKYHTNFFYDATGAAGSPDGIITTLDFDSSSTLFNQVGDYFIVNQSSNLWSTLSSNLAGGEEGGIEFYRLYCDRRNILHRTPAPPFISPSPTAKGTLTKQHLRGSVQVRFHNNQPGQRIGQVQIVAGIRPSTIFNAQYPASPGEGKILKKQSGIWAQTQGRANTLAERLYRWLTRTWTITVSVDAGLVLFGDDGLGLDLGDRLLLTYNGPAEDGDTGAGVALNLSAQSVFIYGINVNFDPARRTATASLQLEHDNSS